MSAKQCRGIILVRTIHRSKQQHHRNMRNLTIEGKSNLWEKQFITEPCTHINNPRQISNRSSKVSAEYKCDHLFDYKVPKSTPLARLLNRLKLQMALFNQQASLGSGILW